MAEEERIRRPTLGRTQPIRTWSTAFSSSNVADHGAPQPTTEAAVDGAANEGVAQSVELGYRVVDEYIRRGRETAERMRTNPLDASALVQDARDLAERMVRNVSDAIGAWAELLDLSSQNSAATNGGAAAATQNASAAEATESGRVTPTQSAPVRVRLCVDSLRRVDVTVDLDRALETIEPVVHALRAANGGDARVNDVSCGMDADGMPAITLRIGADVPAGTYRALVVDGRSAEPVGTLSVVVRER